jgi:hypothetical protein
MSSGSRKDEPKPLASLGEATMFDAELIQPLLPRLEFVSVRASEFRAPRDNGEIGRSAPLPIRLAFGHKGLHSLAKILTAVGIKHQVLTTG